jgi:mono/diheme cytochrome c family protein
VNGFVSEMSGFGGDLTDDQIWDVLGFIRSTWPARVQEMQASRNPLHDP